MTLLWTNSFEADTSNGTPNRWTSGTTVVSAGSARTGTKCGSAGSAATYQVFAAEEHGTFIAGGAFRTYTATSTDYLIFKSDAAATIHVTLRANTDGTISVYRGTAGGTLLGTSSVVLDIVNGSFQYIEAKVILSDTVGSVVVKVDESTVINLTSVDTKNSGTKTVLDSITITGASLDNSANTKTSTMDDLYLCNGGGSTNNDFLGSIHVVAIHPSGNGNSSQWIGSDSDSTNNYLLVQDATVPVTTDYVQTSNTGDEDTYAFDDLTGFTGATVYGIVQVAYAEKLDAGARTLTHVSRLSSTETTVVSPATLINGTFKFAIGVQETKPGGGAWTVTDVNNAEFGIKAS